jgi:polyisoprenoid-binding protein YceI
MGETIVQPLLRNGTLAGEWVLDPTRSSVRLRNRSLAGLIRVKGVFREVSGTGSITPRGSVSGVLVVAAASIDTRNTRRDTHLRSADFFDADRAPDITFAVTDVLASGQGVAVTGSLTVRGRTRSLTFDAAVSLPADGEIWLDAAARVDQADFGMTWTAKGVISGNNTITVHAVFTRRG